MSEEHKFLAKDHVIEAEQEWERFQEIKERDNRDNIIEECARVAEENSPAELYPYNPGARIAAAIRALKDKP